MHVAVEVGGEVAFELAGCAQCGSVAPLTASEYGDLCAVCAHRQGERDDATDNFGHLSASMFGFISEDE